ncbi:hypothetical protein QR680_008614 [Steinernema hermaphroditum]|uniref:Major sperm protein n=1 Tax=Steinernema hermaphroditum TaxID=289476 RepID=A0AA39IH90_9BILA|nr:hypothetical protein QR680_008614 [Steinernema hermaphroditum]
MTSQPKTPMEGAQSHKESSDWELSEKIDRVKPSGKDQIPQPASTGLETPVKQQPPQEKRLRGIEDINVRVKPNLVWVLDNEAMDHTHRLCNEADFPVVFRVLTTSPSIFRVHPVQAVIDGKSFVDIRITRNASPMKSSRFDIQILRFAAEALPQLNGKVALPEKHRLGWFFRTTTVPYVMPTDFPISKELSAVCAQAILNWKPDGKITVDGLAMLIDAMETTDQK